MEGMEIMNDFWVGRRVLITGHTGFKGSWLTELMQTLGADVMGYSLAPKTQPSMYETINVLSHTESIFGDILDLEKLISVCASFQPEIIFHLAAQPLVLDSYSNPKYTFDTNVTGTVNILEVIRKSEYCKAAVIVTSDKCYHNLEQIWSYRENDRLGGHDPYSSSKACAELVVDSYIQSFFKSHRIGVATARAGNVIGGGDWSPNRLLPDLIKGALTNNSVELRYPGAIRPWQHVLEPLWGYVLLAYNLYGDDKGFRGPWNFGPDDADARTVNWIASEVQRQFKCKQLFDEVIAENLHEAQTLTLDSTKSKSKLKWVPKLNVTDAISWTVDWYNAHHNKENMKKMTRNQITTYLSLQNHYDGKSEQLPN